MVVIDNFSNIDWTIGVRNKNAQSKKDAFEKTLKFSKREPHLVETDDGSEFLNKLFTNLLKNKKIRRYSGNNHLGAVFAERFMRTIRDRRKNPFLKRLKTIGLMYYP